MRFVDKSQEDLAAILSMDLRSPVQVADVNRRLIDWIELKNRQLPDEVWKIEKSQEFLSNPFRNEFSSGLAIIESNFASGKSNRAHQSKTTEISEYHDLLFNDWALHHFHLSAEYEGRFCKRTGPLLFVFFQNDTAYFVDILEHGANNPHVWADEHLIAVIDRNWPNISERYRCKGALRLASRIAPEERMKLRRAGIASLLEVNGKVFVPFGLGPNTAKGSTRFSLKTMRLLRALTNSIEDIVDQGNFVYPDSSRLSQAVPRDVRLGKSSAILRMRFNGGRLELFEQKSCQIILYSEKIVG